MEESSESPSTSSNARDDYEPRPKVRRPPPPPTTTTSTTTNSRIRPSQRMPFPIILPKLPAKPSTSSSQGSSAAVRLITSPPPIAPSSSSNPRPLISLLDRTEFRQRGRLVFSLPVEKPKKCYYTELNDIRREFGIPETIDSTKPNTMSGVALSEKLKLLQRLRGENKFLQESINSKEQQCADRTAEIHEVQQVTADTLQHCDLLRQTLDQVELENARMREEIGE